MSAQGCDSQPAPLYLKGSSGHAALLNLITALVVLSFYCKLLLTVRHDQARAASFEMQE